MNIQRWISRREANWKRLDGLLSRVEKKGIKSLQAAEIQEMASLYRSVSADLARARTNQVGETIVRDLQALTSRSYSQIYQGSRRQEWQAVREFYLWGFPAIVRQTWAYTAIATGIFLLGVLIAWWYAWNDPGFMPLMVPESMISQVRDRGELWMGSIIGIEPVASSSIMVNNIGVAFRAVAGGITAGIYTIFILFFNGLLIGAVATLVGQNNLAYPFWAFVFPHGSLELPAIFFAGGAGLLIARGLLLPGKFRLGDSLKFYGYQAAQLVFGIVPMLFVAGIIEGFISPSPVIPEPLKYLLGVSLFVGLVSYCLRRPDAKKMGFSEI
ncbi:stage II sporulation protein M [Ancylothrix sp. C2]|uniref:stage II sporulation protein M n=1 Tax=Ancylothrix sp. D3o TaxID=2953691 RepID=UPI0021BA81D3|nr:stage II sporulation protein M [Ancylothrix sp. D3o]MCT7950651.1 stage II sporulation protein M [Ancylothrix sp. D3o]